MRAALSTMVGAALIAGASGQVRATTVESTLAVTVTVVRSCAIRTPVGDPLTPAVTVACTPAAASSPQPPIMVTSGGRLSWWALPTAQRGPVDVSPPRREPGAIDSPPPLRVQSISRDATLLVINF